MPVLSDYFELTRIINLPERTDRLRQITSQLRALNMQFCSGSVELYAAKKPTECAGFPSCGAHGCFISHLNIFKDAYQRRVSSLLVMEDDCEIPRGNLKKIADAAADLQGRTWDFVYFGHIVSPLSSASSSGLLPFNGPLQTAHLYAINGATLEAAIDYLESCLKRPPGHPLGGPMHLDGALTMFRAAHPEMQTWIAQPSLAFQRSSRSDITYRSFELAPGIRQAITFARLIKRGIRAIRR